MSESWRVTREGRGATDHGVPFLFQPFQLSLCTLATIYERDLPTLRLPLSALGANLSHPRTTSNQPPIPLRPFDPPHKPHFDNTNLMSRMQNVHYECTRTGAGTHSHTGSGPLCSHWGVSGYSSAEAQRWVIKKSNTVNARGHQHINI